jgi:hypothetical protein
LIEPGDMTGDSSKVQVDMGSTSGNTVWIDLLRNIIFFAEI